MRCRSQYERRSTRQKTSTGVTGVNSDANPLKQWERVRTCVSTVADPQQTIGTSATRLNSRFQEAGALFWAWDVCDYASTTPPRRKEMLPLRRYLSFLASLASLDVQ